jgi:hypothetical protein
MISSKKGSSLFARILVMHLYITLQQEIGMNLLIDDGNFAFDFPLSFFFPSFFSRFHVTVSFADGNLWFLWEYNLCSFLCK